jgi:hypothetical protein
MSASPSRSPERLPRAQIDYHHIQHPSPSNHAIEAVVCPCSYTAKQFQAKELGKPYNFVGCPVKLGCFLSSFTNSQQE